MGTNQSKDKKTEVVCEDCKIETQKPLPATDDDANEGGRCRDSYLRVDQCMRKHNHQVTKCIEEWQAFRECHNNQGK